MKKKIRLLHVLSLLLLLPLTLGSCKQEDDINEIFASGQIWHWSGSYTTDNWEHDNAYSDALTREQKAKINNSPNAYLIQFKDDGSLEGKGEKIQFTGTWSADGKSKSFSVRLNPSGQYGELDRLFIQDIQTAKFYRGDSHVIKLFSLEKNYFIQFYPQGFNN